MWATIADITASDGIVHATKEGITEAGAALCRGRLLPAGTLMFSFKLSIGKMAFAGRDLFTNEAIAGLFPLDAERADKHYLRSALALVDYGDLTGHAAMGRTLNRKTLAQLRIPLPPLEEQRRIVADLERQMATAERARRAAEAELAAAEAMPAALLREIFAGSPSELVARGWRCATLNEICQVFNGSTPKSAVDEYWGGDICWITPADLGNLDSPYIRGSARMITRAGYESCSTTLVPAGSVILSSRAPIGHLGIATMPTCTNQGCKSLVPSDAIDGEFLYSALLHSVGELRALGSGATFPEVSKAKVASFPIHLPPMKEQRRIVEDLERQTAAAALARRAATAQLAAAEALPAAILRRTFGGVT